ncbi:unnamed protein product [Arabidopsis arenosa]|uniref:non-specific serine/threonine protein kinase n=1 Tax=Arabidopsis arenosa TaxID=38785 RepID=A0A8S2A773_ARAAE|nr:unnamed protein product [Arabidopsis arenosa]
MGICLMKRCCSWLLLISLLSALTNEIEAISPDGEALLSFRSGVEASDGVIGQWRPEDPDPCNWKGVTCDAKTKRVIALSLTYHKLRGPLAPELGKLDQLRLLMLHNNALYQPIPASLGNCTALEGIYLQNNYISGAIPNEIGNLSGLKNLDISNNNLQGAIPASLGQLKKLTKFNVSNNFLEGQIPSDGLLARLSRDSFNGNLNLCENKSMLCAMTVEILQLLGLQQAKELGRVESKSLVIDVGGGASIVMFHGDLPYASKDIIKKLESLNEEHIIGCGGFGTVYKLSMDDGNVFALKRIVKLNEGFDRFLLYDYLPGGSLDEALHKRGEQLDWDSRVNIIIGAAKGTFGYLAPEYMQSGRATEKTDVYSFGVLVLEVLSGKLPTDASFIEKGFNIVGWLNFLISENRAKEIVDQSCEGVERESLDALLSIATKCVSSSPDERPTMHRVVQLLESEVMTPCPSDFYDSSSMISLPQSLLFQSSIPVLQCSEIGESPHLI